MSAAAAKPKLEPVSAAQVAGAQVRLIVVHCSATPSGRWLWKPAGSAEYRSPDMVMDDWHAQRGFKRTAAARQRFNAYLRALGYHYVIDIDGTLFTGRHPLENGAHVAGFNTGTLGICMVGGQEREARYTPAQWRMLSDLVLALCRHTGVPPIFPLHPRSGSGVCGHRDLSPDADNDGRITPADWLKTCPGFDVGAWLQRGLVPSPRDVWGAA